MCSLFQSEGIPQISGTEKIRTERQPNKLGPERSEGVQQTVPSQPEQQQVEGSRVTRTSGKLDRFRNIYFASCAIPSKVFVNRIFSIIQFFTGVTRRVIVASIVLVQFRD